MKNTPATILHRKHRSPALLLLSLAVLWCVGPAVAQARDAVPAALVVRIEGADIGTPTVALVQRAIRKVSGEGTRYLVLEISSTADDTESMRRVAELLPALQTEELATVAFIDEFAAKAAEVA